MNISKSNHNISGHYPIMLSDVLHILISFCAGYMLKGIGFMTYGLGLKGPGSTASLQITKNKSCQNEFLAHLTKMFP